MQAEGSTFSVSDQRTGVCTEVRVRCKADHSAAGGRGRTRTRANYRPAKAGRGLTAGLASQKQRASLKGCCSERSCCAQVASANELHQSSTRYCAQLQEYNSKLQTDAQATSEQLRALQVRPFASVLDIRSCADACYLFGHTYKIRSSRSRGKKRF
jgi:hypothetical protein